MQPLADELNLPLAKHVPNGPQSFDLGQGYQWFSVRGVSEENRPARIASSLAGFRRIVESYGDPHDSLLVGFSQGAIMALHAVAVGMPSAGVFGISGRLAGPVARRVDWPALYLLHGDADRVILPAIAHATQAWLSEAGASPHLEIFPRLGHAIDERIVQSVRKGIDALSKKRFPGR